MLVVLCITAQRPEHTTPTQYLPSLLRCCDTLPEHTQNHFRVHEPEQTPKEGLI